MLYATTVTTKNELQQIQKLNQQNLKQFLIEEEMLQEGFVSWLYSLDLLQKMQALSSSIIVKENNNVVGYALATLQEASVFHDDLKTMITNIQSVCYKGKPLMQYRFYLMGQICIHKNYRGKGVFDLLYQHHKTIYSKSFELLVTEISSGNHRSLRAHEKLGFKKIYTYSDSIDEWNLVVWDWHNNQSL